MKLLKKLAKSLFSVTPFKASVLITLFFMMISVLYDINPRLIDIINTLSEKSLDYKFQLRGIQRPKSKIVIVSGDEKSFQTYGQWPFDRGTVFAPLFQTICKLGPKAVGSDIVWSEHEKLVPKGIKSAVATALGSKAGQLDEIIQQNSGDYLLGKAIDSCGSKVVLGYAVDSTAARGEAAKEFERRVAQLLDHGKNTINSLSRGQLIYPERRDDPKANVTFYYTARSGLLNVPGITHGEIGQGFFDNDHDSDGNYRHAQFFYRVNDKFVPSLAFRMAEKYLNPEDKQAAIFIQPDAPDEGLGQELRLEIATPNSTIKVPIDLYGQSLINYRGPNNTFPNVSMADVLNGADTIEYDLLESSGNSKHYKVFKSELFKDAMVLVGITAVGLYDIRPRPLDAMASGVENHANILDNIVSDDFLLRPTTEMMLAIMPIVLVLSLLFGFIVTRMNAVWGAGFAAASITGILYFDQSYLFNDRGIVFSGHLQAMQFLFQYLAIMTMKYMREESEKRFIRSAFDKFVSPAVIDSMVKDPGKLKLGGEKKELSIMFSDIRSFTELSERVDVKTLTLFLNEYLGSMTEILQQNRGTLDKYIGDAVMGFWGAPIDEADHARLAVKTAVEMLSKLDELNSVFQKKYGFTIEIGIGINSGSVSVGNFGSHKVFEYTIIGDNVNLTSRLEGLNKYYGTHVIISESTYHALKPGEFLCREVDTVRVKGKQKSVKIYEVFPDNAAHAPLKGVLKTFNDGLMHYYARKWDSALNQFQTVLTAREGDKPTLELIERCNHYKTNPPEQDWDGSWEMHSK